MVNAKLVKKLFLYSVSRLIYIDIETYTYRNNKYIISPEIEYLIQEASIQGRSWLHLKLLPPEMTLLNFLFEKLKVYFLPEFERYKLYRIILISFLTNREHAISKTWLEKFVNKILSPEI
jgi:hypothetical protein